MNHKNILKLKKGDPVIYSPNSVEEEPTIRYFFSVTEDADKKIPKLSKLFSNPIFNFRPSTFILCDSIQSTNIYKDLTDLRNFQQNGFIQPSQFQFHSSRESLLIYDGKKFNNINKIHSFLKSKKETFEQWYSDSKLFSNEIVKIEELFLLNKERKSFLFYPFYYYWLRCIAFIKKYILRLPVFIIVFLIDQFKITFNAQRDYKASKIQRINLESEQRKMSIFGFRKKDKELEIELEKVKSLESETQKKYFELNKSFLTILLSILTILGTIFYFERKTEHLESEIENLNSLNNILKSSLEIKSEEIIDLKLKNLELKEMIKIDQLNEKNKK